MSKRKIVYDASNPQQLADVADDMKDRGRDLDHVMKNERGRRWMYDLIHGICHKDAPSFVPGDRESTAFNEGARSIGNRLDDQIRSDHFDGWMLMMKENHGDE